MFAVVSSYEQSDLDGSPETSLSSRKALDTVAGLIPNISAIVFRVTGLFEFISIKG